MRVTCRPTVLGQALQVVSRAISSRTTLPILNNILIETTADGLALTATNLEIGIRKLVPAEVSVEGSTTAPARLLTDFIGTLPDDELEMTLDATPQSLGLRCARFDTHIKCIEAEEFPPGPRPDEGDKLEVALDDLVGAVEQTQMAASTDEARPVLTGVLVMVQGGNLTLAATDGHRLAVRKLAAAVSPLARDRTNVIRVKAQAGALTLSATTNEVGDSKAEMTAEVDGSDIQIAFNARYVLDALGVIGENEVELLFDGPLSPGLMRPPGKEHYQYVIMPVRVAMS